MDDAGLEPLNAACVRVLGALMEKEMTTPDQYPLTVNALLSASNQRSSREPVMDLSEDDVRGALNVLQARELVVAARDGGRVQRFEHRIRTVLNLRRDETAVLCLLLLRGPQTVGELRSRSERLFAFDDLAGVQAALDRLAGRPQPLVGALARAPGSREVRWGHRLGEAGAEIAAAPVVPARGDLAELVDLVAALTERVRRLEERFGDATAEAEAGSSE